MSAIISDIRAGDDYHIKIQYPYGVNVTGFIFYFTLKRKFQDPDSEAVLRRVLLAEGSEAAIGKVYLHVPKSVTETIPVGSYFWDLKEKTLGGNVRTLAPKEADFNDKIKVIPVVTRNTA